MISMKLLRAAPALLAAPTLLLLTTDTRADITFGNGAQVIDQTTGLILNGPQPPISGNYSVGETGFVRLLHASSNSRLDVAGTSLLSAGLGLYTTSFDLNFRSEIYVDGPDARIQIGSDSARVGNIRLNGKGDFDITAGGVVNWIEPNNCDGSFFTCDILIGATSASNTGIRVLGNGSLLDASNTNGRLFVGYDPSTSSYSPDENVISDSEDFFVAADGGTVLTSGGAVGKGFEGSGWTATGIGFVHGTAFIDNGSWYLQGDVGDDSALNVGEGDGGSGNVFVVNGGLLDITANPGADAGIFLGQTADGDITEGASNLLLIDGAGSTVNIDDNASFVAGSRIANGFATVQNGGALVLDSSLLLVSGNSGAPLSLFNTDLASKAAGITGLSNNNLDVVSAGSITITDSDAQGISALIIGQSPLGLPAESASARVSGAGSSITVSNDPGLPKIPLSATEFGVPRVSNIGTGTLSIDSGGDFSVENGDFVVGVELEDNAQVTIDSGLLSADRIVVGWADFETGGPGLTTATTGDVVLVDGTINGDVYVDDNGVLSGVGTVDGTLFGEGGTIDVGLSPGTIVVESLVLGPGTKLLMEIGLNPDSTINMAASDMIVASAGSLDLSAGEVEFELYSVDASTTVDEILGGSEVLVVTELFQSDEDVVLGSYDLTDASGSISDEELNQRLELVSFDKSACKDGGWQSLDRPDGSSFKNQGRCIRYVNNGF